MNELQVGDNAELRCEIFAQDTGRIWEKGTVVKIVQISASAFGKIVAFRFANNDWWWAMQDQLTKQESDGESDE